LQEQQRSQRRRFYISEPLKEGGAYSLGKDESRHLTKVLRCGIGDEVELVDGNGNITDAYVAAISKLTATVIAYDKQCILLLWVRHSISSKPEYVHVKWLSVISRRQLALGAMSVPLQVAASGTLRRVPKTTPQLDLIVACGMLKGGRSDWLVEKAVELGASTLTPLSTQRAPNLGASNSSGRLDRWERVAKAALKQSLRCHGMQVEEQIRVEEVVQRIKEGAIALLAAEGGRNVVACLRQFAPTREVRFVMCRAGILYEPRNPWYDIIRMLHV
jgi:16S rRNA U1498 N3-methylase RsmE